MNKNCLSYWFPKIQTAGLRVPDTRIVTTDVDLVCLLDGTEPEGWAAFMDELGDAADGNAISIVKDGIVLEVLPALKSQRVAA